MATEEKATGFIDRLSIMADNLLKVATTKAPIGQTPRQAIWTLNKATLYRYTPVTEQKHPVPILLVFALMNKSSIMDLRPGNSFVEYLLSKGYDTWLLDWGTPGPEDAQNGLGDYALEYLPRAVRKLKSYAGVETFTLLGWCIGAMLSTIYSSLRGERDGLQNLILLTAPLDFSKPEAISLAAMTEERYFDVDRVLQAYGNMPAGLIDYGAKMLKPVENFVGGYARLLDNLDNPKVVESWHAMNTWVNDPIPLPGAAFRQFIVDFYRGNKLMKGSLRVRGELVDLSKLTANVLNVIGEDDHITPPCQSENLLEKLGSTDKQLLRVPGGHIGLMAGSAAAKGTWPKIESWLSAHSG
ncbi:MAG TPA: alpha/beta fold hydrolase [Myxococcales bacterium]